MNLFETARATHRILTAQERRAVVGATVATVLIAVLDTVAIALVLPLVTLASGDESASGLTGFITDHFSNVDRTAILAWLVGCVISLFILKDLGALAFTWWLSGFKVLRRVAHSTYLLERFLGAPFAEVSRRGSGELLRTMNDAVLQFYSTTVFGLMTLVSNFATLLAIAAALLLSAPIPSTTIAAIFALAALAYLHILKPRLNRAGAITAESSAAAYRTALAALGGIKEAQLRGSQDFFVDAYRTASLRGAHAARMAGFISSAPRYLLEILFILIVGVMLILGTASSSNTDVNSNLGIMALFVAAGFRALPAVTSVMGQLGNLRYGAGFVQVLLTEMDSHQVLSATNPGNGIPLTNDPSRDLKFTDAVVLRDLRFSYPDATVPVLQDINLRITRGSSIALVGGSGAGKTTLVDVLLGLHKPTAGSIEVDSVNIEHVLPAWQQAIGYVPQEVFLREASLAENIAFDKHRHDIDPSRLSLAVERAQLRDVVASLPNGVESQIGERGSGLSGGQRQRVGIARALYYEPSILVLDEATAALDPETEHKVGMAIDALRGRITMVVVAHRLSTVRHVDIVVLMHQGRIEAVGSFEQLRQQNARFARMVELGSLT